MRFKSLAAATLVLAAAALSPAFAGDTGDAKKGLDFAERTCARCHAVHADDMYSTNPDAPAFTVVAGTPGWTRTALNVFFQTPHKDMPNLVVQGEDKDNIIAYILSLKAEAPDGM